MTYFEKLQAMKADRMSIKLRDIGDEWRTPDELYWGIFQEFGPFVLDLFTDGDNAKCASYFTAADNALAQPWAERLNGGTAFANPPYSRSSYDAENTPVTGMRHIIDKAMAEREQGARIVFLIKAAPSEKWWPEHADHICWIKGRVGFDLPLWAQHLKGSSAGFGQAVVVFDKRWRGAPTQYMQRDTLIKKGLALTAAIEQRAQQLAAQYVEPQPVYAEPAPEYAEPEPLSPELEPLSSEPDGALTGEAAAEPDAAGEPTRFTPEDLHRLWVDGELKADSFPHFIAALVVMFGRQDSYSLRKVRMALVAETADSDNHVFVWGLTEHQCQQIGAFGRWLPKFNIHEPASQAAAVAELVAQGAMCSTSIGEVLTQFSQQLQEVTA